MDDNTETERLKSELARTTQALEEMRRAFDALEAVARRQSEELERLRAQVEHVWQMKVERK